MVDTIVSSGHSINIVNNDCKDIYDMDDIEFVIHRWTNGKRRELLKRFHYTFGSDNLFHVRLWCTTDIGRNTSSTVLYRILSNPDFGIFNYSTSRKEAYLNQLSKIPYISVEQENKLYHKFLKGDDNAIRKICESCLPSILKLAERYHELYPQVDIQDLISAGFIGLYSTAWSYDPSLSKRLFSYAHLKIKSEMRSCIEEFSSMIRVPDAKLKLRNDIEHFVEQYIQEFEIPPTFDTIVDDLKCTWDAFKDAKTFSFIPLVDDDCIVENGVKYQFANPDEDMIDKVLMHESLSFECNRALETLTPRESGILKKLFGIGSPEKSIYEIADELHLTSVVINNNRKNAIRKLETGNRSRILMSFLGWEYDYNSNIPRDDDNYIAYKASLKKKEDKLSEGWMLLFEKRLVQEEIQKIREENKIADAEDAKVDEEIKELQQRYIYKKFSTNLYKQQLKLLKQKYGKVPRKSISDSLLLRERGYNKNILAGKILIYLYNRPCAYVEEMAIDILGDSNNKQLISNCMHEKLYRYVRKNTYSNMYHITKEGQEIAEKKYDLSKYL